MSKELQNQEKQTREEYGAWYSPRKSPRENIKLLILHGLNKKKGKQEESVEKRSIGKKISREKNL